jgi:ABC-type transport system involved in cytochrome bd biosynthesis fused ATPase/permease subunit
MDLGILAAVAMLVVWAVATFFTDAPGWIHLLLTLGVFLLIWRTVARKRDETKKRV